MKIISRNKLDLTHEERLAIRDTWELITKQLQMNGLQVFLRIFELCPEVKKLFGVENVRHSQLARNTVIKGHGTRFMNAIGAAVDNLDDFGQQENLSAWLFSLGQQHKRYAGFVPEYFEIFFEALMRQWERSLDSRFTPEVSDMWSQVFLYIMGKLKEGYFSKEDANETEIRLAA